MTEDVPTKLERAAALFRERNAAYGSNYLEFGKVLMAMLPSGVNIKTEEEAGRLILFCHLVTKLTRYAKSLTRGGHADSLEDLAVYAMMTAEWDDMHRECAADHSGPSFENFLSISGLARVLNLDESDLRAALRAPPDAIHDYLRSLIVSTTPVVAVSQTDES